MCEAFTRSLHFVICVVGVFFSRFSATMNCSWVPKLCCMEAMASARFSNLGKPRKTMEKQQEYAGI